MEEFIVKMKGGSVRARNIGGEIHVQIYRHRKIVFDADIPHENAELFLREYQKKLNEEICQKASKMFLDMVQTVSEQ